ncbi:MAG: hypothetical protein UCN61_02965, partial [Ruminococcus sp.]|nr:hypothetical protein [Ruminococcus sp.]
MKKKLRSSLSLLLSFVMVFSVFAIVPITASAEVGGFVPESEYLTFTAEEAGSSVTLNVSSGSDLQYNKNNSGWQSYTAGAQIDLASVGDSVRFRGKDTTFDDSNFVSIGGKVACSGNVMSLRLDDNGMVQGLSDLCFYCMFMGCTGLTAAPKLPETTLAGACYSYMFYGCTSLNTAPALPATNLADSCYYGMFYDCENLTTAPKLPATTLANECYNSMFEGCKRLTTAPELPATTLAQYCYYHMFAGCSSIKLSETQTAEYSIPYSVPSGGNGTTASAALTGMFANTGGTFKGTPTINTTYYRPLEKYTVTWKNGDDVLKTDTVEEGNAPAYTGTTPVKAEDAENTYTFSGWSDGTNTYGAGDNLPVVNGDVTYTAQFDATPKAHQHDGITFEKWTSDNSLPTEAGNYVLTSDVTLSGTWTVSSNIRLCLNGKGITKNGGNVITIVGGGNLTIDDCGTTTHYFDVNNGQAVNVNTTPGENRKSFTGGYITGGTGENYDGYFWNDGGGIYLDGGNLILNGGTILGNSANFGGGVGIYSGTMTMNGGTVCYNTGNAGISFRTGSYEHNRGIGATTGYFIMNGGLVTNNSSGVTTAGYSYGNDYVTLNGGTIANNDNTGVYSHNLTIAGDVEITGNKDGAGFSNTCSISGNPVITGNTNSNLSINNGKTINTGALGENAKIGIKMSNPGVFTNGYDANNTIDPNEIFTPDDPTTFIEKNANGEIRLGIYVWTASFNAGAGSGTMDSMGVQKERSFNLPECTFTAPEGKLFLNWSDGTNTYNPGDSFTMTADTEFTAQWIDGIKVSFEANGGSGVMEDVISYPDYKLPACGFTAPEGKFFNGWLSSADNQVYQPGDTVTLTAETQFTAQWGREVKYQFDFEDGMPTDWQTSNNNWFLNNRGGDYDIFAAHSGQNNMTYFRGGYGTYGELLTSSFDLSNAESGTLGFYYTNRSWGRDIDQLTVSYKVGDGEWVQIFTTSGNHESWTKEEITLPSEAFAENVRFRFSVNGNYGFGIALDDVELNLIGRKNLIASQSITLDGDIIINFNIDPSAAGLTPENIGNGKELTVTFEWAKDFSNASDKPKTNISKYSKTITVDSSNVGSKIPVSCPVCAAEMSCQVKATATLNGKTGTKVY